MERTVVREILLPFLPNKHGKDGSQGKLTSLSAKVNMERTVVSPFWVNIPSLSAKVNMERTVAREILLPFLPR